MNRKLVTTLFYSVDGRANRPDTFQFDAFDQELAQLMTESIGRIDDVVLGRNSYNEWSSYWPAVTEGPDAGFADFINSTPKHVASMSLQPQDITWSNTKLVHDDLISYIQNLKEQPGRDIAIQGSLSVVRQCVEAGILDEITLILHPVIVGAGSTLCEGIPLTRLQLISASTTSKGNVIITYGPRSEPK
ncbi:Hypothetical protein CpMEX30_1402 [Corynebacterium pseudotuberculosis]|uniref:dihydrofolate reductase family protein n=1 Tax=Corynebacterium pseudotuberculosis TaxID=1719 RepID=UPI000947343B|nr:dihydrofolate reductase family protein [Corynebacterium pseudotuberculosis]AFB72694.2 dihydrofolate reductase [Corynebacterium pseudotuberculosis 316]APQ54430.1 Hypothetical protein CpMEX30_1402 [Corynebacterium pseudotuberculosis]APQ56515.1 Hypothetical protein CpMEX31_1396 [Corynebacterium pseudotuberculosis]ASC75676.1 dihydrofolate reductase [Corynebacterium pseudotuberculosis]AUY60794.1 Hypothetical protein BFG00_1407 [Corynebacterium pseudotuberculosis]